MGAREIEWSEIEKHTSKESCWVVISGQVYDLSGFLAEHPGGARAILKVAGTDATEEFELIHPMGTLSKLPAECLLGVATGEPTAKVEDAPKKESDEFQLPALSAQLNLDDFEKTAKQLLTAKAWAYYFSASDDLVTKNYNNDVYRRVLLRPRIFKDVESVDLASSIAGYKTRMPVFVSPAAMARLAHPAGEKAIAEACGRAGVAQMVSNNASMRFEDIVADPLGAPDQKFFFQLYVQVDRAKSEDLLRTVVGTGHCQGIVLTLDAPVPGKREADERVANEGLLFSENSGMSTADTASQGLGRALFAGTSPKLTWTDLTWLRKQLPDNMPIILKGLQTYEDAVLAAEAAPLVTGILLSNHGGRAMDQSQPPLMVLQEIRANAPHVFDKLEVYVDGGIKRGTDVVKALCLGAKQVGIGRPALFALAGYGSAGVSRVLEILEQEISTAVRLLGCNSLAELGPDHVNTRQLDLLVYSPKL